MKGGVKSDTIAAIATGNSSAGISIIRISGDKAFPAIDRIYRHKNGRRKYQYEKSYHTLWLYCRWK